jgi:hypothetical protein
MRLGIRVFFGKKLCNHPVGTAEAVKPAPRPALPLRKAKPPYKSVKGVLLEANGTVLVCGWALLVSVFEQEVLSCTYAQDESALQLHNGPINAVMRAAMRCSKPNDKSKDVAFAANDDEDADGKILFHGKFAKAGVGKGALKSLLNMYNSVSELKDDEYGSGNESEGESLWDIPSRMPFQGVLLPRSKDLGLSKGNRVDGCSLSGRVEPWRCCWPARSMDVV